MWPSSLSVLSVENAVSIAASAVVLFPSCTPSPSLAAGCGRDPSVDKQRSGYVQPEICSNAAGAGDGKAAFDVAVDGVR